MIWLEPGDCLEIIPRLVAEGIRAASIVTDPPYGLEFMGKEWDAPWQASSKSALFGNREREMPGWGVTRNANCRKCGGRLRGAKKCICDEPNWDETPTSTRLRQMAAFQVWSEKWARACYEILRPGGYLLAFGGTRTFHRMVCAIEDAGFVIQDTICWLYGQGFPKGKMHLKPAFEPICVAYRPGGQRALQVDECRIPIDNQERMVIDARSGSGLSTDGWGNIGNRPIGEKYKSHDLGRWPANVITDGSAEVMEAFAAFGESVSSNKVRHNGAFKSIAKGRDNPRDTFGHADSGTAARFFYCGKAGPEDRWGSKHPTVKPVELIKWLIKLVTPKDGLCLDPFAGSGTTGVAAMATGRSAILIERSEEYVNDIRERIAFYEGAGRHSLVSKARNQPPASTGTLL